MFRRTFETEAERQAYPLGHRDALTGAVFMLRATGKTFAATNKIDGPLVNGALGAVADTIEEQAKENP